MSNGYTRASALPKGAKWQQNGVYEYRDEGKRFIFTVRREVAIYVHDHSPVLDERTGKQRKRYVQHWNGTPGNLKPPGARKLLYRLPELLEEVSRDRSRRVYLVEGEPKVDLLRGWGLTATCAPEGAGKWDAAHAELLRIAKSVVILPDNDEPGRRHADMVGRTLGGVVPERLLLELPGLPAHGDVVDWKRAGGTKEQFAELDVKSARAWTAYHDEEDQVSAPLVLLNTSTWDDGPAPDAEYAVPNRVPKHHTTLLTGEGGAGKSILYMQLMAATMLGRPWLGVTPEQGSAMLIEAEDGEGIIRWRMEKILHHHGAKFADVRRHLHLVSLHGEDAVLGALSRRSSKIEPTPRYHQLLEMAGDLKPKIIGIASSADVFAGSELDRSQVRQFVGLLTRVAIVGGGGVILIAHPSLTGISTGTGLSGTTQWFNAVRAQCYLHGVKPKDEEQPNTDVRLIEFRKNQYGPISESVTLRWQDGLFLPVAGTTFDEAAKRETAKNVFLQILRRFISEERTASDRTGANYAPSQFAEEKEAKDAMCSKRALADAMRDLLREKRIFVGTSGKGSHTRHELNIRSMSEQREIPF